MHCDMPKRKRCRALIGLGILLSSAPITSAFSASTSSAPPSISVATLPNAQQHALSGTCPSAKLDLRHPDCCVVTVSNLNPHLQALQEEFCGGDGPDDLDLRVRVRCDSCDQAYDDCEMIRRAVMKPLAVGNVDDVRREYQRDADESMEGVSENITTQVLVELCRGVASLADGPLTTVHDVHLRIVCASSYRARDPMFHTDKCPLRGYVTLTGPGTQYMNRTCSPVEYGLLRTFGGEALEGNDDLHDSLESAEELEFIVMKGDCYEAPLPSNVELGLADRVMNKLWKRTSACVHRSPPLGDSGGGDTAGRRRVIVSLDLADGDDDQEWYVVGQRRGWRSGMTQRKSRLVA